MLNKINIEGLYGLYDYTLDFTQGEDKRLKIITGPNGYGKTTILQLIYALLCKDTELFYRIPFSRAVFRFEGISYLKWFNHVNRHGINFRNVTIDLNLAVYLSACMANTGKAVSVTPDDLYRFKEAHPEVSKKELSNGHDIFERIYVRAHDFKAGNYPKKPFFRRLRRAYLKDAFMNTGLFRAIRVWEAENGCAVLAG